MERCVDGVKHELEARQGRRRHWRLVLLQPRSGAAIHERSIARIVIAAGGRACGAACTGGTVLIFRAQTPCLLCVPRAQATTACLRVHSHRGGVGQHVSPHRAAGKVLQAARAGGWVQLRHKVGGRRACHAVLSEVGKGGCIPQRGWRGDGKPRPPGTSHWAARHISSRLALIPTDPCHASTPPAPRQPSPSHLRRKVCRLLHAAVGNDHLGSLDCRAKGQGAARTTRTLQGAEREVKAALTDDARACGATACGARKSPCRGMLSQTQSRQGALPDSKQAASMQPAGASAAELTTTTTVLPASGELLASVLLGTAAWEGLRALL